MLKIDVESECDWGGSSPEDVQTLLMSAADHLRHAHPDAMTGKVRIRVFNEPRAECPMTFNRRGKSEEFKIRLKVKFGNLWSQMAYQFAHELCHALSDFERLGENPENHPNAWVDESICEMASLYVLGKMAKRWKQRPAFPGKNRYARIFTEYKENTCRKWAEKAPAHNEKFGTWLSRNEDTLRGGPYDRELNGVVACKLLPQFKSWKGGEGWRTVRRLPATNGRLGEFLDEWHGRVESHDQQFIDRLRRQLMG